MKSFLREERLLIVFLVCVGLVLCQMPPDTTKCGQSFGCLRYPSSCVSGNCTAILTWQNTNDPNYISFTTTYMFASSGWVSFALSTDTQMADDSVVDCIYDGSAVNIEFSYNGDHYNTPFSVNNSNGYLKNQMSSYTNGMISCSFLRSVSGDGGKIFTLNNQWFLFLGFGVASGGTKQQHTVIPQISSKSVSVISEFIDVTPSDPSANPPPSPPGPPPLLPSGNSCQQSMNCISDGLNSMAVFQPLPNSGQVQITMNTTAVNGFGWMGVAFSYDNLMTNDSVVDCILLKNGTIIVKNSYNVPGNNTEVPTPYSGIVVVGTSYMNGTLQCILKRSVTEATGSDKIFNLNQPYYILLASGPIDDQGVKQYHGNTNRYASLNSVDVTSNFLVPRNRYYFLDTLGNSVSFSYLSDTSEMEFELQGPINKTGRWISLGLSNDAYMGNDSVLDCLILTDGSVVVQNSYNFPNPLINLPLNSTEGITVIMTSSNNGRLYCAFRRRLTNFQNSHIFPLDRPYYLLLGDGNLNPDGTKQQHGHTPVVSAFAVDVRTVLSNVSFSGESSISMSPAMTTSPATPGVSTFSDVNGNQILYKLSSDGMSVEFTITGPSVDDAWWIAVGFSYNQQMNNASVLDCIHTPDGNFTVQNSYNDNNRHNTVVNMDGIKVLGTSYSDSQMSCHITRAISSNNVQIYPFNQSYYLLLAAGPASSAGVKQQHQYRSWSPNLMNLTSGSVIQVSSSNKMQLIRAHGCLMITAFVMLMSGAILIARYYKTCWPEDKLCGTAVWFSVHRFVNVVGLFCCAAGFILIFCYSSGKLNRGFGDSPSYFWAHGPMGIAVMILIAMNPLIALVRCDPDHDLRWIFNWLHWFVGTCCQILAGITLFFGIKMGESYKLNHFSVFWILIAFVGFHVFIELVLMLERSVTEHHGRRSFTVTYGMSSPGEPASAVKQDTTASRESLVFRYFILALYVLITMGLWLAMIILLGGGFQV